MKTAYVKASLSVLFLLTLALHFHGSYCVPVPSFFWWGSEPEEFDSATEYGECDWSSGRKAGNPNGYRSGGYDFNVDGGYGQDDGTYIPTQVNFVDPDDLVAAHRTLPLGSFAIVENTNTGRTVSVRIIERGPFVDGRVMTLSRAAFKQIADEDQAVIPCNVSPS